MLKLSLLLLKLLDDLFPNSVAARYKGSYPFIKELNQFPKVRILDLAKSNIAVHCDGPSHACSSYCIRLALKPPKDSRDCQGQLANAKAVS
jgi:hypothetical protein